MATLKTVSEPKYSLELTEVEKDVLTALIAATSGERIAQCLGKKYEALTLAEKNVLTDLWKALGDEGPY